MGAGKGYLTPRLLEMIFFGYFTLLMLTLLQIATGDSWASAITRPMVLGREDGMGGLVGIFMVRVWGVGFRA